MSDYSNNPLVIRWRSKLCPECFKLRIAWFEAARDQKTGVEVGVAGEAYWKRHDNCKECKLKQFLYALQPSEIKP
jgi:hypothetical protein